jgi:outer membrane protein TolC
MKKALFICFIISSAVPAFAQRVLSLDSCRALALRNNKQLNVSKLKTEVAENISKAAKTKYLPKVDALGGYEYNSRSVSLLSDEQKAMFGGIGANLASSAGSHLTNLVTGLVQQGVITPAIGQQLGGVLGQLAAPLEQIGNQMGNNINSAFETDTHNIWAGAVMVRQPVFMGGAITALNKMAKINEQIAANDIDAKQQATLYSIDQAYWLVVSLRQKQELANSYLNLISKLDKDVHKMIKEGVATKADGLKVDVKVNEAEMKITQVENGLSLAKMLLCQLCGLPLSEDIVLEDEAKNDIVTPMVNDDIPETDVAEARPELRMLQNAVDLSKQATNLVRAAYLPHVALAGGYMISNPNVFNGFQRKFAGNWSVGVIVHVPVWNWFEGTYKVRASKVATTMAQLELSDAQEKINLQVAQSQFKVKEARKKLLMAKKNIKSAEENLRCATLGFKEGVIESTDVMAAQTAWQQAMSQKIDAEVDVRMSLINLKKAIGILN